MFDSTSDMSNNPFNMLSKKQTQNTYYEGEDRLSSVEWELQQLKNKLASFSSYERLPNINKSIADYIIEKSGSSTVAYDGKTSKKIIKSTSAQTVIQEIFDTTSEGDMVFINGGEFIVTGLELSVPIRLSGSSSLKTVIKLADSSDDHVIKFEPASDKYFCRFDSFYIDGNKANQSAGNFDGIYFNDHCRDNLFFNLFVEKCKRSCIYLQTGWNNKINACTVEYGDVSGIRVYSGSDTKIVNSKIIYNAIAVDIPSYCSVTGCYFYRNTKEAIKINSGDFNTITGNVFLEDSYGSNTYPEIRVFGGAERNTIIGNTFNCNNVSKYAVQFENYLTNYPMYNQVRGNTINLPATSDYGISAGCENNIIGGIGYETDNAEEPQLTGWLRGDIIDFVDSGDGSGDGVYIKNVSGNWIKLD